LAKRFARVRCCCSSIFQVSGCDNTAKRVSLRAGAQLLPAVAHYHSDASAAWPMVLGGLGVVAHVARCGSTAVANMLHAAPGTTVSSLRANGVYKARQQQQQRSLFKEL
jgi:hypothetical protein